MTVNASTNISVGVLVPTVSAVSLGPAGPMEVIIDDAAKLYFANSGTAATAASVFITYTY
jgi:hypothetical protein